MTTLSINLTLIELIALPLAAIIFGITIYFFVKTRKILKETFRSGRGQLFNQVEKKRHAVNPNHQMLELEKQLSKMKVEPVREREEPVSKVKIKNADEGMVMDMKNTILQQQKLLSSYLQKVEEIEEVGKGELQKENNNLQKEIIKLHNIIESKDEEINDLQQQSSSANKMAAKIEEVYQEFDLLQSKMALLEKQAGQANSLAIELEETQQMYAQVHRELVRKQEKMEELMNDNHRLRNNLETLEDKLAEANMQRQQLQKKVQFLQELNSDMQSLSDTNKKLQTEIRRIGELESMLNMMAEERDYLLKKKMDK